MKILITNNRASLLSLELFVGKDVPNIRVSIPAGGNVDVGETVTLSALNNSPELVSLITSGAVSVISEAESGDIPELNASTVMKMELTDMVGSGGNSTINADPGNTSPDEAGVSGTFSGGADSDWEVVVTKAGAYGTFEVTVFVRGTASVIKAAFAPVSATPVLLADGVSITFTDAGSSVMILRDRWFIDNTATVVAATVTTADVGNTSPDEAVTSGTFSGVADADWDAKVTTGGVYGVFQITVYEAGTSNVVKAAFTPVSTTPVVIADGVSITFTDGGASTMILNDFWLIENTAAVTAATAVAECAGNTSLDEAAVSGVYTGVSGDDWEVVVTKAGTYGTFEVTIYDIGTGNVVKAAFTPVSTTPVVIADGVSITFTDGGASTVVLNDRWFIYNYSGVSTLGIGVASKSGTVKTAKAGTVTIAAAGESLQVDILKNGVSILTGVITLDDSSVSRIAQDGTLDTTKIDVVEGDFFEALLMYTAGGAPTPMVSTLAQIEIDPA